MSEPARSYLELLDEIRTAAEAELEPRSLVDRAAGLLAGKVGCPVREAHAHLLRIAEEQGREPADVAADLVAVLEAAAAPGSQRRVRSLVDAAVGSASRRRRRVPDQPVTVGPTLIQEVLDALPGSHSWLVPVRDAGAQVVDYVTQAASPDAVDIGGRRGVEMIGVSVRSTYGSVVGGPLWEAYQQVMEDGLPRQLGPFRYSESVEGIPAESTYVVRMHRLGAGLLVSWSRLDETARESDRIERMERLGNLGWGEWDLLTGQVTWSPQIYRIYERDPALGPLSREESAAMVLPEDRALRREGAERFAAGESVDVTVRIRVNDKVKYIRSVVDTTRDAAGRPLKIYGIMQDITAREAARARLAEVERQLHEHRESLAAEHRLAAQLQQIILPIPQDAIDLPGIRVAVRYLPAERASRVGGDWYHAAPLADGSVLLAIGDVAGHGLQAATTMAQVRHALAALTVTESDPALLLAYINRMLCGSTAQACTGTAVVARYEPQHGMLTWAQAGHPPPLHVRAGRTVELARPRGPLLGAAVDAVYATASTTFETGDLLVLYTDGLVEYRDRGLREGLAPVIATLNEISGRREPQPLATFLGGLRRANPDDDTCILAARPTGGPR